MQLRAPVIFIIFRRPDVTARVFEQIRLAQPKQLFIIADGSRNEEEIKCCKEARAITEQVDWDCKVFRDYSDVNLGCRRRVSSGLNWVFEQVEEAIILEDDCVPDQSFFKFCSTLLEYYRYDTRIMHISGNNFQFGNIRGDGSYYFSRGGGIWGWATWARAWKLYDAEMKSFPVFLEKKHYFQLFADKTQERARMKNFHLVYQKKVDTWDFQWAYSIYINHGLCIIPNKNLVENIGFDMDATHTKIPPKYLDRLKTESLEDVRHPTFIIPDLEADRFDFYIHFGQSNSTLQKLRHLIVYKILKKIVKRLKNITPSFLNVNQREGS